MNKLKHGPNFFFSLSNVSAVELLHPVFVERFFFSVGIYYAFELEISYIIIQKMTMIMKTTQNASIKTFNAE